MMALCPLENHSWNANAYYNLFHNIDTNPNIDKDAMILVFYSSL